jgi:hypothetical protein
MVRRRSNQPSDSPQPGDSQHPDDAAARRLRAESHDRPPAPVLNREQMKLLRAHGFEIEPSGFPGPIGTIAMARAVLTQVPLFRLVMGLRAQECGQASQRGEVLHARNKLDTDSQNCREYLAQATEREDYYRTLVG